MSKIYVDKEICKGCAVCVSFCPLKLIKMSDSVVNSSGYAVAEMQSDKCTACAICAMMCPDSAITVVKEDRKWKY